MNKLLEAGACLKDMGPCRLIKSPFLTRDTPLISRRIHNSGTPNIKFVRIPAPVFLTLEYD